ncbi:MAG: tetratricopeptide repeat protein [Pseudomonadota bacterium]
MSSSSSKTSGVLMKILHKINRLIFVLWASLAAVAPVVAGDVEDAYAAYDANDFLEAATLVRPLAREGVADAEYLYGRMFERGEGVVKDIQQAKTLYESAARHGHAKAKQRLVELAKAAPATSGGGRNNVPPPASSAVAARAPIESVTASLSADPPRPLQRDEARGEEPHNAAPAAPLRPRGEESVALNWYLDSANRGDPDAQYNLGVLYESGLGVAVNEMEAARWYREAVPAKHDGAQLRLGLILLARGDNSALNEGNKLLRASAGGGNKIAERLVQDILDPQRPGNDAQATIARNLREALLQGETRALALLRDPNALTASSGATRNAVQGEARTFGDERVASFAANGQSNVPPARRFDEGNGLSNESRTLRERQSKAPFLSDPVDGQPPRLVDGSNGSQVVFPPSMASGTVPPPPTGLARESGETDNVAAVRLAASQGQGDAQFQLGVQLLSGKGVRRDETEGWQWIRKAASQQHEAAKIFVRLIDVSSGVAATQSRAVSWLLDGARQGDSEAMVQLADVYDAGRGVPQDPSLAADWFRVAAALGHPSALRRVAGGGAGAGDASDASANPFAVQPRSNQAASGDWLWILLTAAAAIAVLVMLFRSPTANFDMGRLAVPPMGGAARRLFGGGLAPTQMHVNDVQILQDLWAPEPARPAMPASAEAPPKRPRPAASAPSPQDPQEKTPMNGGVEVTSSMVDLTAAPVTPPTPPPAPAPKTAVPPGPTPEQITVAKGVVDISELPAIPPGFEICPETGTLVMKAPIIDLDALAAQAKMAVALVPPPVVVETAPAKPIRTSVADSRLPGDRLLTVEPDDITTRSVARAQRTRERVSFDQFADIPIGMGGAQHVTPHTHTPPAVAIEEAVQAEPLEPHAVLDNLITLPEETGEGGGAVPFNVGMMFYRGQGAPKNDKMAFRWLLKAAELGHAEAQHRIGEMYMHGAGVEQNRLLALKWIRKAAAAAYSPAIQALEDRKPKVLS